MGAASFLLVFPVSRSMGVPVLGTPEYFLALDAGYRGDHAAWGETSLMVYLDPGSVDLTQPGRPPHQGWAGTTRAKQRVPTTKSSLRSST